jgi:CheY-like chemotaxis protein
MPRVLVVEDEPVIRRLIVRMLEEAGYDVLQAEDGLAALDLIHAVNGALDLLVTDVVMPRMSGAELVDRARAEYPSMNILCISGYADPIVPKGHHFLPKPFTAAALVATIQKLFGMCGTGRVGETRHKETDLQARVEAAKTKLEATKHEYQRFAKLSSDAVDSHSDGRLALGQAMAARLRAFTEYDQALKDWKEYLNGTRDSARRFLEESESRPATTPKHQR